MKCCDRCGAVINDCPLVQKRLPMYRVEKFIGLTGWRIVDLCPDCEKELKERFEEWLKNNDTAEM